MKTLLTFFLSIFCLAGLAQQTNRTPLNRAFLQSNLDGSGKQGTNFGTLTATNFINAATGLPIGSGGSSSGITNGADATLKTLIVTNGNFQADDGGNVFAGEVSVVGDVIVTNDLVLGGIIYDIEQNEVLDSQNRILFDNNNQVAARFSQINRSLIDTNDATVLDWLNISNATFSGTAATSTTSKGITDSNGMNRLTAVAGANGGTTLFSGDGTPFITGSASSKAVILYDYRSDARMQINNTTTALYDSNQVAQLTLVSGLTTIAGALTAGSYNGLPNQTNSNTAQLDRDPQTFAGVNKFAQTSVTGATNTSLTASMLVGTDANKKLASSDLTGDVTTSGGLATTLAATIANSHTFSGSITLSGGFLATSANSNAVMVVGSDGKAMLVLNGTNNSVWCPTNIFFGTTKQSQMNQSGQLGLGVAANASYDLAANSIRIGSQIACNTLVETGTQIAIGTAGGTLIVLKADAVSLTGVSGMGIKNGLWATNTIYVPNLNLTTTNVPPSPFVIATTVPSVWFVVTNGTTKYLVPGYTP